MIVHPNGATMIRSLFATLFLLSVLPAKGDEPIGAGAADLPIFDAHIHYKEPAWGPFPPETVIEMFDRNGVAMALVSSTPDQGTIKLWEFAPARIVPELRPYRGNYGSGNWMDMIGMRGYLADRLDRYPHQGIGEFHVRAMDGADEALLRDVARMALERGIPVHIHSGAAPVQFFFDAEPELKVIWAHAGMSSPPSEVQAMMDKHERLFADTSFREGDILRGGGMDPDWRALLMRHADRFMVGSDTWVNGQWSRYDAIIEQNRAWLALLPRREAEMIAFRNAEALFKRKVTSGLLGKRK